jgi:hypothetical protein
MAGNEGLEFLFEINAKFQEVALMVKKLKETEEALKRTDEVVKKTSVGMRMLQSATNGLKQHFHHAREEFNEFSRDTVSHLVGYASWDGLKDGVRLVADLGKEMLVTSMHSQRSSRAWKLFAGADAKGLKEAAGEFSKQTEFTDDQVKGLMAGLMRSGFKGESMSRALSAATDLAALTPGVKSNEQAFGAADNAVWLLSGIKSTGGVNTRMLRQFGITQEDFYKGIEKATGMSRKAAKKATAEGKLNAETQIEVLYSAIMAKTGMALGGAGKSMADTLVSQWAKFEDVPEGYFKSLKDSPGMQMLADSLGKVTAALDPDTPRGRAIKASLDQMFTGIARSIAGIDFDTLSGRIQNVLGLIQWGVEATMTLGSAIASVFEFLTGFGAELGEQLYNVVEWLNELPDKVWELSGQIGQAMIDGIVNALVSGPGAILDAVGGLADAAIGGLKSVLGIASPSRVFKELGSQTSAGFALGIESGERGVGNSVTRLSDAAISPASAGATTTNNLGSTLHAGGIVINVSGVSEAGEVGGAAADAVRMALQSILEQFHAEVGA